MTYTGTTIPVPPSAAYIGTINRIFLEAPHKNMTITFDGEPINEKLLSVC